MIISVAYLQFFTGRVDGVLLGDSGYNTKRYLLTPFVNPTLPHEIRYNRAHSRTRVVIEQTFGIIKRRFGILRDKVRLSPVKACKITVACAVLHNIGIDEGDIIPDHHDNLHAPVNHDGPAMPNDQDGLRVREYVARTYFS